jgi:hypothetical protein
MFGIGKLFTTSDGKVPFIQIALGLIIGAIGVLVYVRFYKPAFLFPPSTTSAPQRSSITVRPAGKRKPEGKVAEDARERHQPGYDPEDGLIGAPVVLNMGTLQPGPRAPELPMPTMYPVDDEEESEDDDDDEEEIDDDEVMLQTSGLTEIQ